MSELATISSPCMWQLTTELRPTSSASLLASFSINYGTEGINSGRYVLHSMGAGRIGHLILWRETHGCKCDSLLTILLW